MLQLDYRRRNRLILGEIMLEWERFILINESFRALHRDKGVTEYL